MNSLKDSAVLAARILEDWDEICRSRPEPVRAAPAPRSAREEERLQVLEAVAAELRIEEPGRDRLAACRFLLEHLAGAGAAAS